MYFSMSFGSLAWVFVSVAVLLAPRIAPSLARHPVRIRMLRLLSFTVKMFITPVVMAVVQMLDCTPFLGRGST